MKNLILGNTYLQKYFEFLFKVAVKGMNYDRGHIPELSGEKFVLKLIQKKYKNQPIIIFDVGANKGQYSALVNEVFLGKCSIFAFEPSEKAFQILQKVAILNFKAIHLGLGSSKQNVEIYYDEDGSVRSTLYPKIDYSQYNIHLEKSQMVQITTLDNFCEENQISKIDFLKIDVEGHELEALKGAKSMLSKNAIQYIQFEFGIAAIESRIFLKDFFVILKNYKIYRILQNGLFEIHYHEKYELFLTTNYLAIHRSFK